MSTVRCKRLHVLVAALVLPLAACDLVEQNSRSTAKQETAASVTTFVGSVPYETGALGNRNPADDGRMILVPATTLFPGTAWVDPEIKNPYSGNAEAIAAGERHFEAFNCAGCHAPLGGGGMGPPLSDNAWIYGSEPAQIYLSIMHGRPEGMPAWGSMLPQRTVWELAAYVEMLPQVENPAKRLGFEPGSPFEQTGQEEGQDGGSPKEQ